MSPGGSSFDLIPLVGAATADNLKKANQQETKFTGKHQENQETLLLFLVKLCGCLGGSLLILNLFLLARRQDHHHLTAFHLGHLLDGGKIL